MLMGYSHHYCVHGLFAEQAARAPSAPAIVQRGRTMSYGEVAAEADRIMVASGAGVGPDTVVGLYTGRSMETVCAILAILAAGGAVCPLDPRLPAARLRFMIADAAPAIVLGRDRLPPVEGPLPVDVRGDNLAYVTYTSGSLVCQRQWRMSIVASPTWYDSRANRWRLSRGIAFCSLPT